MDLPAELEARISLPGSVSSPADARRFVARTLTPSLGREDVEAGVLVTSELVTNAVVHAGTGCELVLRITSGSLTIRVTDDSPAERTRGRFAADLPVGRGLRLLEVLSRRWGVESTEAGKTVWCELNVHAGRPG